MLVEEEEEEAPRGVRLMFPILDFFGGYLVLERDGMTGLAGAGG